MAGNIDFTLDVQISGGPSASFSQSVPVEAYDKIDVAVDGGDSTTPAKATVDVQPSGTGKVKFLLIRSSLYDPKLTYAVDKGSSVALDAPQLFVGEGAVGLVGATQKQFVFTNQAGKSQPASIQILVGRYAKA